MNHITPHQIPDQHRLATAQDVTIARLIELRRAFNVPNARLRAAGVPTLVSLEAERLRRERGREMVAT